MRRSAGNRRGGTRVSNANLITALAGVLVVLPNALPAVAGLNLTPEMHAVLLILSLVGAAILKQQEPVGRQRVQEDGELSDQEVERIAQARERIRRAEIAKVREAGKLP